MELVWLGHSCFRLRGREAVVITDPYGRHLGTSLGLPTADIVTVSHQSPGHDFVPGVGGTPRVLTGPGEYEIGGVLITGIATYHDQESGQKRGKNTIFVIELEDLTVCHAGDLGHIPSAAQLERMGNVDVLLIPVGGHTTIDAAQAAETVSLVEPRLVIPMHFQAAAARPDLDPVDKFLKEMGVTALEPQSRLSVSHSNLPEATQVVLLDYRR